MPRTAALLVCLCIVVSLCIVPAEALTGFVTEAQMRAFDPFAVDVFVEFLAPLYAAALFGETGYYAYNPAYMAEGGFPLVGATVSSFFDVNSVADASVLGDTINGQDTVATIGDSLIGVEFPDWAAIGFFLTDVAPHDSYGGGGEYITRAVRRSNSALSRFNYDNFKGVDDVFIGYINDVMGFQGLWAGWYRPVPIESRSVDTRAIYNAAGHFLAPSAYVGAGGDPHMVNSLTPILTQTHTVTPFELTRSQSPNLDTILTV
jgi:hypothetical protein